MEVRPALCSIRTPPTPASTSNTSSSVCGGGERVTLVKPPSKQSSVVLGYHADSYETESCTAFREP